MKLFFKMVLIIQLLYVTACVETENKSAEQNEVVDKETSLTEEQIIKRQQRVFAEASEAPRQFRDSLKKNCPHFNSVLLTTAETIQLGTRVFNAGGISLTNRIYEGTVYKILFTISNECMELSDALQAGLIMAEAKESYHDKAWALRSTLDLIMGGPPLQPSGN